jgi:2-oxoglutarate dehydrogenase complex dehydrogenase (E1) component-like enzyme
MYINDRVKSIAEGNIDWATAEAMALGSLRFEGFNSRLVGEDSERGTFS